MPKKLSPAARRKAKRERKRNPKPKLKPVELTPFDELPEGPVWTTLLGATDERIGWTYEFRLIFDAPVSCGPELIEQLHSLGWQEQSPYDSTTVFTGKGGRFSTSRTEFNIASRHGRHGLTDLDALLLHVSHAFSDRVKAYAIEYYDPDAEPNPYGPYDPTWHHDERARDFLREMYP